MLLGQLCFQNLLTQSSSIKYMCIDSKCIIRECFGHSLCRDDQVFIYYPSPTHSVCEDTLVGECVS